MQLSCFRLKLASYLEECRRLLHKAPIPNPIYPEILFDQRVLKRSCAKRRQAKPSRDEAEGLAQMTGVEQHDAVGTSVMILPHGSPKNGSH